MKASNTINIHEKNTFIVCCFFINFVFSAINQFKGFHTNNYVLMLTDQQCSFERYKTNHMQILFIKEDSKTIQVSIVDDFLNYSPWICEKCLQSCKKVLMLQRYANIYKFDLSKQIPLDLKTISSLKPKYHDIIMQNGLLENITAESNINGKNLESSLYCGLNSQQNPSYQINTQTIVNFEKFIPDCQTLVLLSGGNVYLIASKQEFNSIYNICDSDDIFCVNLYLDNIRKKFCLNRAWLVSLRLSSEVFDQNIKLFSIDINSIYCYFENNN